MKHQAVACRRGYDDLFVRVSGILIGRESLCPRAMLFLKITFGNAFRLSRVDSIALAMYVRSGWHYWKLPGRQCSPVKRFCLFSPQKIERAAGRRDYVAAEE
jgi:hypothetical protein